MDRKMERAAELLEKLQGIKALASDVDGTITADRKSYLIPPEVIEGMTLLKKSGIKLFFVSANAFPIVYGLARYLGADGIVAENGCFVSALGKGKEPPSVTELCRDSSRSIAKFIAESFPDKFRESWQNEFRRYDFALEVLDESLDSARIRELVSSALAKTGLHDRVDVNYSGYAVHITPKGAGKLRGLKHLISSFGIRMDEVAGIGDSYMDWDFIREAGVKVAVANADRELLERADIVTDFDSGYGFAQLCRALAEAKMLGNSSRPPEGKAKEDL